MKPHCVFIVPGDFGSVGKICSRAVGKDGAGMWDSDVIWGTSVLCFVISPKAKSTFCWLLGSFWRLNLPDEPSCLGWAGCVGGIFNISGNISAVSGTWPSGWHPCMLCSSKSLFLALCLLLWSPGAAGLCWHSQNVFPVLVPVHPSSPSGIRILLTLGRSLTHSSVPSIEVKYFYDSSSPGVFPGILWCDSLIFPWGKADKCCFCCFGEMQKNVTQVFSEALQTWKQI